MRISTRMARSAAAVIIVAAIGAPFACMAWGATLVPVLQTRTVRGFVSVPPCSPSTSGTVNSAPDFEPYDVSVLVARECELASGIADATQHSLILPARLQAMSHAIPTVSSQVNTVIHAFPGSLYDVTFQLTAPVQYVISGTLECQGALPVVFARSTLHLTNSDGQNILERQAVISLNNPHVITNVNETGLLAAGTYRLRIETNCGVDAQVPPNGTGFGIFDILATFQREGDVNIDGSVDIDDLLAIVEAWGPCPAPPATCPGDIDPPPSAGGGDGIVNINDLLQVIANWG